MIRTLIVSYELTDPAHNHEPLLKLIKAYATWARVSGSAYLIQTDSEPNEVRDILKTALGANDKLYVGASVAPSAWIGLPEEVSKWIRASQK